MTHIVRKTIGNRWIHLITPEDTTPNGERSPGVGGCPDTVVGRLKSILWLALSILAGLAMGRL